MTFNDANEVTPVFDREVLCWNEDRGYFIGKLKQFSGWVAVDKERGDVTARPDVWVGLPDDPSEHVIEESWEEGDEVSFKE